MPNAFNIGKRPKNPIWPQMTPDTVFSKKIEIRHHLMGHLISDGYPLDSGAPNRLCFCFGSRLSWVDDAVVGDRVDGHGLLCEAKEKLATAF